MANETVPENHAANSEAAAGDTPVDRRWMQIAGAAVMVGVMLVAAFSVGVWVGNGRDDPAVFAGPGGAGGFGGAQGQPRQGAQGQAPGQFGQGGRGLEQGGFFDALSREPDVVGQVQWIEGDTIGLNSPTGQAVVTLTPETEILLTDGSPGGRNDVSQGRIVAVIGGPSDDGRSLEADELALLPERR